MTTVYAIRTGADRAIQRGWESDTQSRPLPRTWQACHDELARRDIDPTRRATVELTLENIRRGSC